MSLLFSITVTQYIFHPIFCPLHSTSHISFRIKNRFWIQVDELGHLPKWPSWGSKQATFCKHSFSCVCVHAQWTHLVTLFQSRCNGFSSRAGTTHRVRFVAKNGHTLLKIEAETHITLFCNRIEYGLEKLFVTFLFMEDNKAQFWKSI